MYKCRELVQGGATGVALKQDSTEAAQRLTARKTSTCLKTGDPWRKIVLGEGEGKMEHNRKSGAVHALRGKKLCGSLE